jgi:hypothetical protein
VWLAERFPQRCIGAKCGGATDHYESVASTSLAILAFLGAGETPKSPARKELFKKTLKGFQALQKADGRVGDADEHNAQLAQAYAACAATEWYGMTSAAPMKRFASQAIAFIVSAQHASGGWKAEQVDPACDVVTTAVSILALRSAKVCDLPVDDAAFERAVKWVETRSDPQTGAVAVKSTEDRQTDDALTAAALSARVFGLWNAKDSAFLKDPLVVKLADLVAARAPTLDDKGPDLYASSLAAPALFQTGGEPWTAWWKTFTGVVLKRQRSDAAKCDRGSWDSDRSLPFTGRVATTALMCRALESPYVFGRPNQKK